MVSNLEGPSAAVKRHLAPEIGATQSDLARVLAKIAGDHHLLAVRQPKVVVKPR